MQVVQITNNLGHMYGSLRRVWRSVVQVIFVNHFGDYVTYCECPPSQTQLIQIPLPSVLEAKTQYTLGISMSLKETPFSSAITALRMKEISLTHFHSFLFFLLKRKKGTSASPSFDCRQVFVRRSTRKLSWPL
jgi:hypothetical protein